MFIISLHTQIVDTPAAVTFDNVEPLGYFGDELVTLMVMILIQREFNILPSTLFVIRSVLEQSRVPTIYT
jgi:hypothetical protein